MRSSSHSLEITAKTVDEAVEQALRQLGVPRSEVEIVVLKEGRVGFLGFGAEDAVVRVSLRQGDGPRLTPTVPAPTITRPPAVRAGPARSAVEQEGPPEVDETGETAQIILEDLIDRMHLHAAVRQTSGERRPRQGDDDDRSLVTLDIRGEDMGLLIGRRGETLTALQLMLNMLVSRRLKRRTTVTVDVEGYRRRREEDMERMAQRIAGQVKANGEPFTFEPMQSRERRLIHMALANDARVMTESTGDGDQRRVVVMPRSGGPSRPGSPSSRSSSRPRTAQPEPFDEPDEMPVDEPQDRRSDNAQEKPFDQDQDTPIDEPQRRP